MNKMETSTLSPESIIRVPTGSSASPSPTTLMVATMNSTQPTASNLMSTSLNVAGELISPPMVTRSSPSHASPLTVSHNSSTTANIFVNASAFECTDYNGSTIDNCVSSTSPRVPVSMSSPGSVSVSLAASTSSAAMAASLLSTARVAAAARAKAFYSNTRPGNGRLLEFLQHSNSMDSEKYHEILQYQVHSHNASMLFPPLPQQIIGLDSRLISWEMLQETTARLLFMAVRWVKCLTPFQSLTRHDQLLLLQVQADNICATLS